MAFQFQIEETPAYLAARFTGAGRVEEIWRQFELIAEHCKRANKNKLLLDFTEARGDVSVAERYLLGDEAEIFLFFKLIKVAIAARPEQLDPRRFGEMVIRNRWINASVFTNVEDAQEWLLK